jgi:hypothetical protein
MGEPDGEESKEVLNALCRYEPSSVDRQASSRPHRWRNRFSLGAGGRQRDLHRHWPQPIRPPDEAAVIVPCTARGP